MRATAALGLVATLAVGCTGADADLAALGRAATTSPLPTAPPAQPPSEITSAAPARASDAYTGTYANDHYGPMTVSAQGDELTMSLGPDERRFVLSHYDGDTFFYRTTGEMAVGLSGVTFTVGSDGRADKVRVENLDTSGLGTFTRKE
ncbi:DUF3471 domain-containing protein [Streptomyces hydrogenans]|uniref:DUF3471 domain-containing protein n=1 Tax=Streptomyces hydrogenans TaxID=1873719 RepID=UPI00380C728C